MTDAQTTNGLEMRWTPVVDPSGRTHMEARWILTDEAHSVSTAQAA